MRSTSARKTPFSEGRASVKTNIAAANPYDEGSVEHRNFELGRSFGIKHFAGARFQLAAEPRA